MTTPWDRPYTVKRYAEGTVVDGDLVAPAPTELEVVGVIDPLTPRQLELLPQGTRQRAKWQLLVEDPLQPVLRLASVVGQTESDRIVYAGREYVVESDMDFSDPPAGDPGGDTAHHNYVLAEESEDE